MTARTMRSLAALLLVTVATASSTTLRPEPLFQHTSTTTSTTDPANNSNSQSTDTTAIIPNTGQDWFSFSPQRSFQPAVSDDPATQLALQQHQRRFLGYKDNFIDGTETYYDPRSQNWRLLGFYIDCHAQEKDNGNGDDHDRRKRNRKLEGGDDDHAECQRYLLWAGYIDLNYQGGGVGEYQYYDTYNQEWDTGPCEVHGNGRCAKMDCHLQDTSMVLLGFFKNAGYDDWFEQLFKHEGVCVWKEDEYDFMDAYRQVWPEYCSVSTIKYKGNYLYYDIKPTNGGEMGIGLYLDSACSSEYRGGKSTKNLLTGRSDCSYDDDDGCTNLDIDMDTFLETWNAALDVFKVCQPCVAYDIGEDGGDDHEDDRRQQRKRRNKERGLGEDEGVSDYVNDGYFECEDEAGYTNVNQCMKFGTHTELETATFQDMVLASQQKTVLVPNVQGILAAGFVKAKQEYAFTVFALLVLLSGVVFFSWATRRRRRRRSHHHSSRVSDQPLV